MDDNENEIFDKLQELSGMLTNNFSMIDEPIDMKLQLAYFRRSHRVKKSNADKENTIDDIGSLYDADISDIELQDRLIMLSSFDDPRAYRIIEEYASNKQNRQHQWAMLALQESKMLIEGNLLEEHQVFVSTGLGGRGTLLRYFVALIGNNIDNFAPYQEHIIQSEFESALKANRSEIESIEFKGKYAALTVLIPVDVAFHKMLYSAVEECNQLGNFLRTDFLVTNVKILSFDEIVDIVENNKMPDTKDYDIEVDELDDKESPFPDTEE